MTIEERIQRLERTNRRHRLMFTLIGVLAVCATGISATQDAGVPDVIQAKRFEAVDDEGNILITIKANSPSLTNPSVSGSLIQMNTKTAKGLITMSAIAGLGHGFPTLTTISIDSPEHSGALYLAPGSLLIMNEDAEGEGRALVQLDIDQGMGSLKFFDGSGGFESPVTLRFDGKTGGLLARAILVVDDKNRVLSMIGRSGTNGGRIEVYNKTGEGVCTLTVDEYGNGVIGAWDRKGKGRTLKPGP